MNTIEPWLKFIIQYLFPTISIILAVWSFVRAIKSSKIEHRLKEIEEQLKKYELEDKQREIEDAKKANIEARIIHISRNKYVLKIWNSGVATAYNVNFEIPEEVNCVIFRDKVPYEFLESNKSFEENMAVYINTTSRKFKITTTWENDKGEHFSKEQIVSI